MGAQRVVVVGQGYVGLPVAIRAVEVGFDVVGIELDRGKVAQLNEGRSHVEDVSAARLGEAIASGRYRASSSPADAEGFDVAVISVPTPLREGAPDLTFVESAARQLGPHVRAGATVILESTTYPGTTEDLVVPILEAGSGLSIGAFHVGYSPERIDPGNPTYTLVNTPKVVSGVDDASLKSVQAFFDQLVDTTVAVRSPKEAELTKLLENTFRHVNVALVNELAMFAHDLDIDVWEAIDAASTKPFGFMRFTPGPGVGGHCLPIDPSYLSWEVKRSLGRPFRFVELANDVNEHMPDYVVQRISVALNRRSLSVRGQRILLLGLAYKRNTGDARESPSILVAEKLLELGAEVVAADDHVRADQIPKGITSVPFSAEEIAAAGAVVVLVDHDEFDMALVREHSEFVLDTRAVVPLGPNVERL